MVRYMVCKFQMMNSLDGFSEMRIIHVHTGRVCVCVREIGKMAVNHMIVIIIIIIIVISRSNSSVDVD